MLDHDDDNDDIKKKGLLSDNTQSICIPIMNIHTSKAFIYYVFERFLGKNIVKRVDLVTKKDKRGTVFKRGFVHLHHWNNSVHHNHIREILLRGDCIHLVYDTNFNYWKCYKSTAQKPI